MTARLEKVVVVTRYENAEENFVTTYHVHSLGETPVRQRAEARKALVLANKGRVIQHVEHFNDGTIREIE